MELRDYQKKMATENRRAWSQGAQVVVDVLPCGGGKTLIIGDEINQTDGISCAIAHRRELVGQMSVTLARLGVHHRIIAPSSTIGEIVTLHMREVGRSYHDTNARAAAASVDSLVSRGEEVKAWAQRAKLWVTDECFPAGTLVDGRPIETLRVGDFVTAFDEATDAFSKCRVSDVFKNPAPRHMVRLTLEGGNIIRSTREHPFWTGRGWVRAFSLRLEDVVLDAVRGCWVRVTRLASYETGPTSFVYNIEVEGLHTYTANGIVVHNCHHLVRGNKWSRALDLFPSDCRGLGVTATPERADGKGLGRHADGFADIMVEGPVPRDLIDMGFLTDFRIFGPESDLDVSAVPISDATGDYSQPALREATKKSRVTGDIVSNYKRLAPGKLGVTFAVSVELAEETAAQFRAAGVVAEALSAKTPALIRSSVLRRFANRDIMQLVNVDLFGEGFDLAAMEVISMGRRTASFPSFYQMFWRPCRPAPGKDKAMIIDHVGNVLYHAMRGGMPDAARQWSLDRRERRARTVNGPAPVRACLECTGIYERWHVKCPYCGWVPVPQSRAAPEFVDGDLTEMDPAALAALNARTVRPFSVPYGAEPAVVGRLQRIHREHGQAQAVLREQIAWWAGWQRALGRDDPEAYRRFYLEFGTDVITAQTGDKAAMTGLAERIGRVLERNGVVAEQERAA